MPTPKCTVDRRQGHFKVACSLGDYEIGQLEAWESTAIDSTPVMRVRGIEVARGHRRRGYGTLMYELAAATACETYGRPLASDSKMSRAPNAAAFWRKQKRKGRARATDSGGKTPQEYILSCPAPVSLARAR